MSDSEEIKALREEARYWKREALKARKKASATSERASSMARPVVNVVQGETYYRVLVNNVRIEGWEEKEVAENVASRLRKAFKPKVSG
jgi:hypothetical protein